MSFANSGHWGQRTNRDEFLRRSIDILSSRSKDLRVAVQALRGLAVVKADLEGQRRRTEDVLLGLLTNHWDRLHPRDQRERATAGLWEFLSPSSSREKPSESEQVDLFQIWSEVPLTRPINGARGLSFRDYNNCISRKAMGPWEEGVRRTPKAFYDDLGAQLRSIRNSFAGLTALLRKQAGSEPEEVEIELIGLTDARGKIDEYAKVVEASKESRLTRVVTKSGTTRSLFRSKVIQAPIRYCSGTWHLSLQPSD